MAAKSIMMSPPRLQDDFTNWLHEIEVWKCVTDLEAKKQGPMIYLSLEGQARRLCSTIKIDDLKGEDGADKVISKLKEFYAKDAEQLAFDAYEKFEMFQRPVEMTIADYCNEFDIRYNSIKEKKMDLPEGVLAYRLLKSANLSKEKQALVRATVSSLTYADMKKTIRAVHDKTVSVKFSPDVNVKVEEAYAVYEEDEQEEEVFYNNRFSQSQTKGATRSWKGGYDRDSHNRGNKYFDRGGSQRRGSSRGGRPFVARGNGRSKKNLSDRNGNTSKCFVCESIFHWARDCPHSESNEMTITLLATREVEENYMANFLGETLNTAVLDSGCSKTVCGEVWLNCYLKSLSEEDLELIKEKEGGSKFKFGTGDVLLSQKKVVIPAVIGSKQVMIETDVVSTNIPLLLSKDSMKAANTKIDFSSDHVNMLEQNIKLKYISSGHYAVPIGNTGELVMADKTNNLKTVNEILLVNNNTISFSKSRESKAKKLHLQFGHASSHKIEEILIDAGNKDNDLVKSVYKFEEMCKICQTFKKAKLRPAVGLSLAKEFNENVSMDLKDYEGKKILHIIDHATRFSTTCIIPSKDKKVVVDKIFKFWIALFGCPKKFLSDNGGEFNNELFRDMSELLGTDVMTTAAESPWSNGITERHNAIIADMIDKIKVDVDCSLEVALAWAVSAKNALKNHYGYSPNQLVFGRNPNFPTAIDDKPPALEGLTSSQLIADHLNAMHAARKAFIATESSEKIRRALRAKTRTATSLIYNTGDKVYYKKKDSKRWHGPGLVIGKAVKQIFVKHGGTYLRVNPCNIRMTVEEGNDESEKGKEEKVEDVEYSDNRIVDDDIEDLQQERSVSDGNQDGHDEQNEGPVQENAGGIEQNDSILEQNIDTTVVENRQDDTIMSTNSEAGRGLEEPKKYIVFPKCGSKIQYMLPDSCTWKDGRVMSRAGKATGKNKFWYNIQDLSDESLASINLEEVKEWRYKEEEILYVANDNTEILEAKMKELKNLRAHNVFDEVVDEGQKRISSRWVLSEKAKDGDSIIKARLVARGYEENEIQMRKDSPTAVKENLRLLMVIASSNHWEIKSLDIKSAFLQGKEIEREVFLKPPKEAGKGVLWKLNKTIYGLMDASRKFYLKLKEVLLSVEVEMSIFDEALFFWKKNSKLQGILALHVDDLLFCGSLLFINEVIHTIKITFKISKEETKVFQHLGLEIEQTQDVIYVHQGEYIKNMQPLKVDNAKKKTDALSTSEYEELRSHVGQLMWTANQTRPDISFDVCQISVNLKMATKEDVLRTNKCIQKMKSLEIKLHFPDIGDLSKASLVCYSDASLANLKDAGSQGGFIVFIVGKSGKCAPLVWQSRKIKRVVKSTLAAETMALLEGTESCYLIKSTLLEILGLTNDNNILRITAVTDNKSLYDTVHSTKTIEDKRLKVDICALRDMMKRKEIHDIEWTEADNQIADSFTKAGASVSKLIAALSGVKGVISV